ncbi:MAG: hypothetical protein KDE19_19910 [Caldilineaceae bacterium]|nr:hypothetical protein [Caldilineaceae bacterium]
MGSSTLRTDNVTNRFSNLGTGGAQPPPTLPTDNTLWGKDQIDAMIEQSVEPPYQRTALVAWPGALDNLLSYTFSFLHALHLGEMFHAYATRHHATDWLAHW